MPASKHQTPVLTTADLIVSSPVALAFKVFGDRWSWLILRDLFLGYRRFEDLRRRSGAARGTLTSRLNSLVDNGVLYRNPYQEGPTRYEYRLTDKGFGLYPVALMVWSWECEWTRDHDELPPALRHRICDKATEPVLVCEACGDVIVATDVSYSAGPGARPAPARELGGQRRRRPKKVHPEGVDETFFHAVDIIGDRWTGMVLAAIWFSLHRYDDIAAAIGIATNILADRLKRLTLAGVLERRAYRDNPPRYEYRLTKKGRDLYGITIMLHQWADRWLTGKAGTSLYLTHKCQSPLIGVVACRECSKPLEPGDVSYGDPAA